MSPTLAFTATLSTLAEKWGVSADLTPLAIREQAYNDMLAAALARDDAAWDDAKRRFDTLEGREG